MADGREMFTIRARDKTTQKDLILKVPKDASIEEVMSEYTRKFNEQEGKQLSKDEFRQDPLVALPTLPPQVCVEWTDSG